MLVLAENLLPYTFPTAFGSLQSDGLLLWTTMFRWGEVPQYGPRTIPRWEQVASRGLKWLVVLITGGTTLLLGLGGLWALTGGPAAANLGGRLLAAAFCFALMWLTAWFTVHLAKQPVARVRGGVPSPFSVRAIEELRAQSWWTMDSVEAHRFAEDVQAGRFREATLAVETALKRSPRDVFLLMQKGDCQKLQGDFAGAESTYDEALSLVSDAHSTGYLWLLAAKLQCMLEREEVDRADELCVAYLDGPAQIAEKKQWVDHVVCWALFHEPPRHLRQMERWTRKALGLAPTSLTLKGNRVTPGARSKAVTRPSTSRSIPCGSVRAGRISRRPPRWIISAAKSSTCPRWNWNVRSTEPKSRSARAAIGWSWRPFLRTLKRPSNMGRTSARCWPTSTTPRKGPVCASVKCAPRCSDIAQLYKLRWRVELFFKWIKQNLRIKHFFETSDNAVKTQVWIAICVYVLIAIVRKELRLQLSLSQILQILSVNVFE